MTSAISDSTFAHRDPSTAARLSLVPGLGQLYNGETRKGLLFLAVATINLVAFTCMIFANQIVSAMKAFGESFHMTPNGLFAATLRQGHFGSIVSFIFLGFFLTFVVFCIRDAYDHAALRRRKIYPDFVLQLPEATSGSYIVHFSIMAALGLLTFFFILPPPPHKQFTVIEFMPMQDPSMIRPETLRVAPTNATRQGRHNPRRPVQVTTHAPAAQQQHQQQQHAQTHPQPQQHSQAQQQQQPQSHSVPVPKPNAIPMPNLTNMFAPAPRVTAATTPAAVAPAPNLTVARTPATPNVVPMPNAGAPRLAAGLPSLAPTAIQRGAGGGPAPVPAGRPGQGVQGLPTIAPGPVGIGSSSGPSAPGVPSARIGTPGGGPFAGGPPAPVSGGPTIGHGPSSGPTTGGGPVPSAGGKRGTTNNNNSSNGPGAPGPVAARGKFGPYSRGMDVTPAVGNPAADGPVGPPKVETRTGDPDMTGYMDELQRRIKRAWFPPKDGETKKVIVVFKIHSGGQLSHLTISRSSGMASADQAALKAVENAAPFRALPDGCPENVDVQFTFDYNVYSGGGRGTFRHF